MSWVRIDDHAPEHPKMLAAGPVACWLWIWGLAYSSRQLTDGFIPSDAIYLSGIKKPERYADRLMDVGLWDRVMPTDRSDLDGYNIHDYHEYQPTKAQVSERRKRSTERVQAWKARKGYVGGNGGANRVDNAVTTPAPIPVPVPVPVPVPKEPTLCVQPANANFLTKPLAYKPRIDVAWPGRPPVPGSLHAEFISKLGGDPTDADRKLAAWYPIAAAPYEYQPIGDDDFAFWRARFREWIGTTVKPVHPKPDESPSAAQLASEARQHLAARGQR